MLYGRVKRSPHAHAIIKSIDTSKAEALPGVKAVVTAADFPLDPSETFATVVRGPDQPPRRRRRTSSPRTRCSTSATPVAAVAAIDAHTAEDALDLIEVEYEVLPPVLDVREAMVRTARHRAARLPAHRSDAASRAEPPDDQTNVALAPPVEDRRRRAGLRRGRRHRRARVHDDDVPPGLHRAAERRPRTGSRTAR